MPRFLKGYVFLSLVIFNLAISGLAVGQDKLLPPSIQVENFWPTPFRVNDEVTIHVVGLQGCPRDGDYAANKLIPFLNGRPMTGNYPEYVDLKDEQVRFTLPFTEGYRKAWLQVLATPSDKISLSVGWLTNGAVPVSKSAKFERSSFRETVLWVSAPLLLVLTIILAVRTNLIRDKSILAAPPKGKEYTYSLGRSQMAWWFLIIAISFLYIWSLTGTWSLSSQALILLGISGATGLSAAAIDASKQQKATTAVDSLLAEKVTEARKITAIDSAVLSAEKAGLVPSEMLGLIKTANDERLELLNKRLLIARRDTVPPPSHSNFFADILSDTDGISLHRFQMFIWTIVLGVGFVYTVMTSLSMPILDDKLLLLAGISGGTYVGFKFPEQK